MMMEKKAWVEPKVEAVEFHANEYVTTCYTANSVWTGTDVENFFGSNGGAMEPSSEIFYEGGSVSALGIGFNENAFNGDTAFNDGFITQVTGITPDSASGMTEIIDVRDKDIWIFVSKADPGKFFLANGKDSFTAYTYGSSVFS